MIEESIKQQERYKFMKEIDSL